MDENVRGEGGRGRAFQVTVSEPAKSNGVLKTWFVFEGGAQTGDGKSRAREGGIAKAYSYGSGGWEFE